VGQELLELLRSRSGLGNQRVWCTRKRFELSSFFAAVEIVRIRQD
jgi:hypothetical protein